MSFRVEIETKIQSIPVFIAADHYEEDNQEFFDGISVRHMRVIAKGAFLNDRFIDRNFDEIIQKLNSARHGYDR